MITILVLSLFAILALTMAVGTPIIKGVSTIVWGTEGQLGSPAGAIVESISITPKNPSGIGQVENGDGAGVADILLDDGFDAKISCIYDASKAWPITGATVTLTIPKLGGTGMFAYTGYVTGMPEVNTSKKKEATISFTVRYRPGITS